MQWIRPGTEVHSDEWRSYRRLANLPVNPPYVHLTVNHSRNFVDPVTNACTNCVENMWMHAKKIRAANGSSTGLMPGYFDEFL